MEHLTCEPPRHRETLECHSTFPSSPNLVRPFVLTLSGQSEREAICPQPSTEPPRGTQIAMPGHTPFGVSDSHPLAGITVGESGCACVRIDGHPQTSRRG